MCRARVWVLLAGLVVDIWRHGEAGLATAPWCRQGRACDARVAEGQGEGGLDKWAAQLPSRGRAHDTLIAVAVGSVEGGEAVVLELGTRTVMGRDDLG